jgi:peptide/nickel transport system substrate-binding protein
VAIQTGELDLLLTPVSGAAYKTLSGNPDVAIGEFMSARNEAIHMYCKDGIFSDVRMRKAVAHAISKEDILIVAVDGQGQVIHYPGDVGSAITANPEYVPSIAYEQDVEKARALVKEAGMEGASVVIKSYNTDPYATVGTYLQGALSEIGLNATVEPMERATFLSQLNNEMCEIFPLGWVSNSYDIEETLGALLHSANLGTAGNYSFYVNPELDAMIEAARGTTDVEARKALYVKVIDIMMEDVPFVPVYAVRSAIPRRADITTDNPKSYLLFDYRWVK